MKTFGILRFVLAAALIAVTAILLQARTHTEVIPQHLLLSSFPAQLANWDSTEIVQDKQTLEVLGPGDFLERVYQDPNGKLPSVDLFLAYFPSQRAGETPHSPQHCLPGSALLNTACPGPDGIPRKTSALHYPSRGTGPFPPTVMSSPRVARAGWCCTGSGPTTAAWPANTGPSFIW